MIMKPTPVPALLCLVLLLACALVSAGCTSMPPSDTSSGQGSPAATSERISSPAAPPAQETAVMTAAAVTTTLATTPATTTLTMSTFTNTTYGLTITYPADWEKEELSSIGLRDYGRTTLNLANLYSPDITQERKDMDGPNPDKSTYSTLSIDVDMSPVTDFQQYFNLVTLALQKSYGSITITKHEYQLDISKTDTNPDGYDAYQMDFDTKTMRGKYIFVDVDDTIYIFAFRNPSPYSSEVEEMYKSIVITPVVTSTKHR